MPTTFLYNKTYNPNWQAFAGYPAGLRNNNPGNLRRTNIDWQGKIPFAKSTNSSFEQFIELRYGIRAMMRDLISDIKNGKNTITKVISEYAPAHENNTIAYINSVAGALGLDANTIIEPTEETIIAFCKIIATVENGAAWAAKIKDSDYRDALNILGIELKKKATQPPIA